MTPIATVTRFDGVPGSFGAKSPDDVLDYGFNYPALAAGESLTGTPAVTVEPPGLTVNSATIAGTMAVLWLAGGVPGTSYTIACTINTTQGRTLASGAVLHVGPVGLDDPSAIAPGGP
jgi:hypothetical protein